MSTPPPRPPLQIRAPWLHPTRWPVMVGAVLVYWAAWLPWQSQQLPFSGPPEVTTGMNTQAAPGAQLMVMAGLALVFSLSRGVAGTSIEPLQWMPLIFGIATALIAIENLQILVPNWHASASQASTVAVEPGLLLAVLGSLAVAVGGGLVTWISVRDRRRRRGPVKRVVREAVDTLARYQRPH